MRGPRAERLAERYIRALTKSTYSQLVENNSHRDIAAERPPKLKIKIQFEVKDKDSVRSQGRFLDLRDALARLGLHLIAGLLRRIFRCAFRLQRFGMEDAVPSKAAVGQRL